MRRSLAIGAALILILLLTIGWGVGAYNGFVRREVAVEGSWAQVQNVYQRRLDLVPNLVETVKGAAQFERETFTAVTEARAKVSQIQITPQQLEDPSLLRQFQQAQGELSSALSRLLVTVERYPDLKATQNYRDLQVQLEGTENRIAVERRRFNEVVQEYNTALRVFPGSVLARLMGFLPKAFFEADDEAQHAPKVQF